MARGNKGEWSEFYTFLKLVADKQLNGADENLQKLPEILYPVLKIIREEASGKFEFEFINDREVHIQQDDISVAVVNSDDLKVSVSEIFKAIQQANDTTFEIPEADGLMNRFRVQRLNAGNARKEDLILKIHDPVTCTQPEVGFSIKSMLGSPATLLNASAATNFIYKITGLDKEQIAEINKIDTRSKVRDRIAAVKAAGATIRFEGCSSETFSRNLRRIDTVLPEILSQLILEFYSGKGSAFTDLIPGINYSDQKVINFDLNQTDYEFKVKGLLYNAALGMVPQTNWDGLTKAHGGYIIVREDGEIVCYHLYNADMFRTYLYKNAKFETPSTTKHGFGKIYIENGEAYIKLNLQIRFSR